MNKIILLAGANIRKTKRQTVVLALLFIIASMVLNIGLIVLLDFGNFFDRTAEQLRTSDVHFSIPEAMFTEEVAQYLREETDEMQLNSGILSVMTLSWRDESTPMLNLLIDKDEHRDISKWMLVGDHLPESPDAIYLPYRYKVSGGYELGDSMTIELNDRLFSFTVAGYVELIYDDAMLMPDTLLVPGARYQEISEAALDSKRVLVYANGVENYGLIETALIEMTGADPSGYGADTRLLIGAIDYQTVRANRTSMAAIISAMMVVFTIVIAAVCLLVIRFRISNSIEEDMPKIGSLKSIGYSSRQITNSIMVQYGIIALLACLAGLIPSYLLLPQVGDVFAVQSGLLWESGFQPVWNIVSVASLTFVVAVTSFIAALKIRTISPVQALRGGMMTHSFKRNHVPLDKTRMPLTIAMSLKAVLQGKRQSITASIILAAISLTAVFAATMYYNAAVDLSTFEQVPGLERSNATIYVMPGQDLESLKNEISAHEDVRLAQYMDASRVTVDGIFCGAVVMEHYNARATDTIYTGIYPRYSNEIAISGLLSSMLGKTIGDMVTVGASGQAYLITGLTQGMESGSPLTVYLTLDGKQSIEPDFQLLMLMIYLNRGTDTAAFVSEMEAEYDDRSYMVVDADINFAEGVSSFASIVSIVGLVILIVAGFVVILVLYFVISSLIIRKRRELGIQKAIGYTTVSLMNQITLSIAFPVLLGAFAGCLIAAATINPIMSIGMAGLGVMKANFIIDATWVTISGISIVVLSYITSLLITWRIRKISAYALVTE